MYDRIGVDEASDTTLRFNIADEDIGTLAGAEIEWWMWGQEGIPLIRKSVGDGIEIQDFENRIFEVSLEPGDTLGMSGAYRYEVAVRDGNGHTVFVGKGVIVVLATLVRFDA